MYRKILALILVLALGAAVLGCARTPEATPDGPAVLTFANTVPIPTLDPALITDEAGYIGVLNLYDPLLYPRVREGSMAPGPNLATDWTVSADGKVYRFNLRRGVKFHNGAELTAEDVAFSMDRVLSLRRGPAAYWLAVLAPGDTKVVDRYTVEFHLRQPFAPFIATLLHLFIVNKDLVTANLKPGDHGSFQDYGLDFLSANTAGSGPYVLERWDREGDLIANRFDDYWQGWRAGQVDRFVYKTVREEATVKMMIRTGEADMVGQWLSVETYRELAATAGITVAADPTVQLFVLHMNNTKPPLDCPYFRLAMVHALDYETANRDIFPDAVRAKGPVPVKAHGHNPAVPVYEFSLEKARGYLAQSRYAPGQHKIQYHFTDVIPAQRMLGLLLQSALNELGVTMEINPTPWVRLTELTAKPDTTPHMGAFFITLRYPHPHSHTWGLYHPSAHGSWLGMTWYDNPEVARVLDQAVTETNAARQLELYQQAQALIVADAPSIWVNNPIHRVAHRERVKGYFYNGLMGFDLNIYYLTVDR